MAFAKVKVTGLNKVNRVLQSLGKKAPKVLGAALFEEGEGIIGESKEKHVPVDQGTLRNSGFVELPKTSGLRGVFVELGFGGPAGKGNQAGTSNKETVGYALIVHENLTARHTVGRAKYLEIPFRKAQRGIDKRVAARMVRAEPRFK